MASSHGSVNERRLGNGHTARSVSIVAPDGTTATFIDRGATLTHLLVADRQGQLDDVVLGFDDVADYFRPHPHVGCIVGRCANRIRDSRFVIDGVEHQLLPTHGPHHLHGGPDGFGTRTWELTEASPNGVAFVLTSPAGDQGYPGSVTVTARYAFTPSSALRLEIDAECDAPTPVNLSAHHYFNLAGATRDCGIERHRVQLDASHYLPMDDAFLPTGEIAEVSGTPFDLRVAATLESRLRTADPQIVLAGGFDHNWVIDGTSLRTCARVFEPDTGRRMTIRTDQPGVQFYTGNSLAIAGKHGRLNGKHGGLCLETQGFPNAINEPRFPPVLLRPGARYRSITEWQFDAAGS